MDVILVDDDGNKLGRAYLTICIDVFTRSVLGYHISLKGTSTESVLDCIKHAVLPKSNHSDIYPNVETSWEQFGLFETIIVDNGKEFHSRGFKDFCLHYNIIIERCAVKAGHQKGIVEKFFDRLNKAIFHHLEGTTFSNTQMRKNYNSQKKAKLTLTDLHELITTWIINIYHNHPHSGLAYKTPNEVWNENIKLPQIRLVNNINDLEKLIGNHYERQINPTGILLEYLTYNSRALQEIRKSSHLEEKTKTHFKKINNHPKSI